MGIKGSQWEFMSIESIGTGDLKEQETARSALIIAVYAANIAIL